MTTTIQKAVKKISEEMKRDMTEKYFRTIDEIHDRMLKRELSNPVIDPMSPVSGAKYARFVEYGAPKPPHHVEHP